MKTVLTSTNSLYSGSISVRGRPEYRVGMRYVVKNKTARDATSGRAWYVASITQQGTWGEDWTTSMELLYPQDAPAVTRRQASA